MHTFHQRSSLHFTSLHFTTLRFTLLHLTSLPVTSLHSQFCTSLHFWTFRHHASLNLHFSSYVLYFYLRNGAVDRNSVPQNETQWLSVKQWTKQVTINFKLNQGLQLYYAVLLCSVRISRFLNQCSWIVQTGTRTVWWSHESIFLLPPPPAPQSTPRKGIRLGNKITVFARVICALFFLFWPLKNRGA